MGWQDDPVVQMPAQAMPTPAAQTPMLPQASQPLSPQRTPNIAAATSQPGTPPPSLPGNTSQPVSSQRPQPQWMSDPVVQQPQQAAAPQNSLAGSSRAVGSGLVNAASNLIGLPGDAWNLANRALGRGDDYGKTWGSEAAKQGIQKSFGVSDYEPQTGLESYLKTGAEFAGGMAFPAGDIGLGAKFLRLVAAPAIASETAGQLTKGTAAEPYARIAGGVAGGYLGNKIGDALASRAITRANPLQNSAQLGNAAEATYQGPINNLVFKDAAVDDLQNQMRASLGNRNPRLANGTHAIIDALDTPIDGQASTWNDIKGARDLLGQQAGKFADPVDAGAATAAKGAMDDWLKKMPQSYLQSGNVSEIPKYFTANRNYQVMKALDMLEGKEYAAEMGAAAANSGANFENAMRQRIKGILLSPAQRRQFESLPNGDQVISAMENVTRGGTIDNLVRALSNIVGGGGGMHAGLLGIGGAMLGHPEAALAPIAGWGLKALRNRSINNQLGDIKNMIAQGAPANAATITARNALQARLQSLSPQQRALINAALSGQNQPLLTQQQSQ